MSRFHRTALDAYGELEPKLRKVETAWTALVSAREAYDAHQARLDRAESERAFLEHALKEMHELDPQPGEEATLADKRQMMMNAEEFSSVVNEAQKAVSDGDTISALNTAHCASWKDAVNRQKAGSTRCAPRWSAPSSR